jgi:cyclohexanecarboxyl-CoA dehydrogenase
MLFTDDQIALRDVARRFARERLKPHYQKREAESGFDRALMKEMGSM